MSIVTRTGNKPALLVPSEQTMVESVIDVNEHVLEPILTDTLVWSEPKFEPVIVKTPEVPEFGETETTVGVLETRYSKKRELVLKYVCPELKNKN